MPTLFDLADRAAILQRLDSLKPDSPRGWGKMNSAQMLTHCSRALEVGCGDKHRKQALIGKLLSPFVRSSVLGDKPFSRNSPTDPTFIVTDEHDFAAERTRLAAIIDRFAQLGEAEAGKATHSFFGTLTGDEWGRLMYKHLDHHLRQFGA